jgi:peptidoglycan glycosyltransferase/penicillin-binding protein 2
MRRKKKNIVEIRLLKLAYILLSIMFFLIFRLYWIQIANHEHLKSEALKQRANAVNLYPNRGIIYDMNLIPLTNRDRIITLFVPKDSLQSDRKLEEFILEYAAITRKELNDYKKSSNKILAFPLKKSINEELLPKNAFVAERTLRYSQDNILSHVIGYIKKSENKGEYGIELIYDDVLTNYKNKQILYLELDDNKNILLNGEYQVSRNTKSSEPAGVKLTIDYHIQKIVENVLDKNRVNGAVIVSDVESGEIRALASRPNFDQDNTDKYRENEDMALYNKAIQAKYPPGSLFKIVVLLTALEEGMDYLDRTFYCKGYEEIGKIRISCNNTEGHGYLNLKDAFSKSCNSVFIQLGKELGSQKIINMAKRLGLGSAINIGLSEEVEGHLPSGDDIKGPAIGNISIGQGSIEVTPLQITNLLMIIANDGIEKGLTIVDGITDENGRVIKKYNRREDERVLSEENCQIVKDYLKDVVDNGTAKRLDLDEVGGAAGKTGSAQGVLKGKEVIHGWFTGYYPADNPKYVITVLDEEAKSGSQSAVPIFEEIVKEIYMLNR